MASVFGVVIALVVLEVVLRTFATGQRTDWLTVPLLADAESGPVTEVRDYHEGVAVSHFSNAHARLTGAPFLQRAPVGVILGDSYIEARQLDDRSTVGALIEQKSRRSGVALNVRQYGWSGASIPQYMTIAPDVMRRWNPPWVVVELNDQDLLDQRVSPHPGGALHPLPADSTFGTLSFARLRLKHGGLAYSVAASILEHSTLAYLLFWRTRELRGSVVNGELIPRSNAQTPRADDVARQVDALRATYGERLVILYVATIPVTGSPSDSLDVLLRNACKSLSVACASTRDPMLRARDDDDRFARGFTNGSPGVGHPNTLGHSIMAEVTWNALVRSGLIATPRPTTASSRPVH